MTKVSVVMGVYGDSPQLPETMGSILSQEDVDLECVVVADGHLGSAAEQHLAACERDDRRLRVVRKSHEGLTRALIVGCEAASGEYIARIDVGDKMHARRLVKQSSTLDQFPECVLVSCRTEVCGPEWELLWINKGAPESSEPVWLNVGDPNSGLAGDIPHHGSTMFRRSTYFQCGGYRGDFYYGQDWDLWYRLADVGTYQALPEVLYSVRLLPGGISMQRWRQQREIAVCSKGAYIARCRGEDESPWLARARAIRPVPEQVARGWTNWWGGGDGYYMVGEALRRNADLRCRGYLKLAIRKAPLNPRPYIRLLQSYLDPSSRETMGGHS